MDENEFKRLLDLFPVVRSRDYHPDSDSKESTSQTTQDELTEWRNNWDLDEENTRETEVLGINHQDAFWQRLKLAAEKKVGPESAEKFCKAFQTIYKKLVFNELSEDAAQRFKILHQVSEGSNLCISENKVHEVILTFPPGEN